MKRKKFLSRLIGEMTGFLLESNPLRLVVSLHQEEDGAHITFFDDTQRTDAEIKRIKEALNPKKVRPELADYYGAMAERHAQHRCPSQAHRLADRHATVSNSESGIKIDLWLGSDAFNPQDFTVEGTGNTIYPQGYIIKSTH